MYVIIGLTTLIAFVFGQVDGKRLVIYTVWLISQTILTVAPTLRYDFLRDIIPSPVTASAFFTLAVLLIHWALYNSKFGSKLNNIIPGKLPKTWNSIIISIVLAAIFASLAFGITFIPSRAADLFSSLVKPIGDRLGITVAENRQPYFSEWSNSFGPVIGGTPIYFWLFMIGSIYLVHKIMRHFHRKERMYAVGAYTLFLLAIVFSRYAQNSILNGINFASLVVYLGGGLIFLITIGIVYFKRDKENNLENFANIDIGPVMLMIFFIISILSARGAVRLVMVLVPPTSIIVGYFFVAMLGNFKKIEGDEVKKIVYMTVAGIVCLATIYTGYQMFVASSSMSAGYVPNMYTQQWQKSMSWVRENVQENAVFAHWWDYGYWVQSIGERATMLDGGNVWPYWNYLMGRYGLTGNSSYEAAELFYSHNITHFLIDSTDIGKYTAFSSIGSDDNYDRRSWIGTFVRDPAKTSETKNTTANIYTGGMNLDEDIVYEYNGTKIFLPGLDAGNFDSATSLAGIGGAIVEFDKVSGKMIQPKGIYADSRGQYILPIRYAFYNGTFTDFGEGVEAGLFFMPLVSASNNQAQIDPNGAMLYLSRRVVKSQLARLYLYGQDDEYFKTVHIEDDLVVQELKAQGVSFGHFVYYQGLRGPINIWEVKYPSNMKVKQEYLSTSFPKDKKFTI